MPPLAGRPGVRLVCYSRRAEAAGQQPEPPDRRKSANCIPYTSTSRASESNPRRQFAGGILAYTVPLIAGRPGVQSVCYSRRAEAVGHAALGRRRSIDHQRKVFHNHIESIRVRKPRTRERAMGRASASRAAKRAGAARMQDRNAEHARANRAMQWLGTPQSDDGWHKQLEETGYVVLPIPIASRGARLTAHEVTHLQQQVRTLRLTKKQAKRLQTEIAELQKDGLKVGGGVFQGETRRHRPHRGDGYRLSRFASVTTGDGVRKLRAIVDSVRAELAREFPHLRNAEADTSLLLAEAGASHQPAHIDQALDAALLALARATPGRVPVSVIVSLEHETSLDVWPLSHLASVRFFGDAPFPDPSVAPTMRRIRIPAYHMVVFFATTVHAGSAYEDANLRLHMYFDHPDAPRTRDTTFLVSMLPQRRMAKDYFARPQEN